MSKPPPPWLERAARVLQKDAPYSLGASELNQMLAEHQGKMHIPAWLGPREVTKAFLSAGVLRKESLLPLSRPKSNDGREYRAIERFVRKGASAVHVALSLRPNSYISHASAAQHHGLIPASADRVYVNREQSPKPDSSGTLSQEAIDRAFANAPRTSNLIYGFKKTEIHLLSGKNTGNHGVVALSGKLGEKIKVTSIERTLVDMTVRPAYSGGVQTVLAAFLAARGAISVPNIVAALKALQYVYPYHQSLGFYLQRVGLPATALAPLKKFPIDFNFYLAHKISAPLLDPEWRVFYPKEISASSTDAQHSQVTPQHARARSRPHKG